MEEASESLLILARTAFLLGSTELQVYCLLRALALARKRGPSACLAKAYSACALWRTALGLSQRRALGFCLNAHDLAHDLKDVGLELKVLTITCRFYMQCGNWRKAAAGLSRASWLAESIGNTREWEQVVNQLATLTALEGDWAEASSLYKLASHSSFARDDREMYAISMIGVASSNLRLGMVRAVCGVAVAAVPLANVQRVGVCVVCVLSTGGARTGGADRGHDGGIYHIAGDPHSLQRPRCRHHGGTGAARHSHPPSCGGCTAGVARWHAAGAVFLRRGPHADAGCPAWAGGRVGL